MRHYYMSLCQIRKGLEKKRKRYIKKQRRALTEHIGRVKRVIEGEKMKIEIVGILLSHTYDHLMTCCVSGVSIDTKHGLLLIHALTRKKHEDIRDRLLMIEGGGEVVPRACEFTMIHAIYMCLVKHRVKYLIKALGWTT
jgi:DNA recombination-dependent growth factor C